MSGNVFSTSKRYQLKDRCSSLLPIHGDNISESSLVIQTMQGLNSVFNPFVLSYSIHHGLMYEQRFQSMTNVANSIPNFESYVVTIGGGSGHRFSVRLVV